MDSPVVWFPQICEATCEMPRLAALDVLDSLSDEAFSKEYAARSVPFLLRLGALKFPEAGDLRSAARGLRRSDRERPFRQYGRSW